VAERGEDRTSPLPRVELGDSSFLAHDSSLTDFRSDAVWVQLDYGVNQPTLTGFRATSSAYPPAHDVAAHNRERPGSGDLILDDWLKDRELSREERREAIRAERLSMRFDAGLAAAGNLATILFFGSMIGISVLIVQQGHPKTGGTLAGIVTLAAIAAVNRRHIDTLVTKVLGSDESGTS